MLKTLLWVAKSDLNNPFSWISPDIIKLFYGPHDTFISLVSALYPVRGAGGGFLYYMLLCSSLCYCSVRSQLQDIQVNLAAARTSGAPSTH